MTLVSLLSAAGLIVVAFAQNEWQAIFGIIITSFSSGLGETSMLAYTAKFNRLISNQTKECYESLLHCCCIIVIHT